jgi:hypothetical protein
VAGRFPFLSSELFGGSPALDAFDMLTPAVNWVEKGTVPESVNVTGRAFHGLCQQ